MFLDRSIIEWKTKPRLSGKGCLVKWIHLLLILVHHDNGGRSRFLLHFGRLRAVRTTCWLSHNMTIPPQSSSLLLALYWSYLKNTMGLLFTLSILVTPPGHLNLSIFAVCSFWTWYSLSGHYNIRPKSLFNMFFEFILLTIII